MLETVQVEKKKKTVHRLLNDRRRVVYVCMTKQNVPFVFSCVHLDMPAWGENWLRNTFCSLILGQEMAIEIWNVIFINDACSCVRAYVCVCVKRPGSLNGFLRFPVLYALPFFLGSFSCSVYPCAVKTPELLCIKWNKIKLMKLCLISAKI